MTSKAYVFIDGLDAAPVICGVFEQKGERGFFRYGQSYLKSSEAFALDPINLPLSDTIYETNVSKGLFGVLSDAGPDSWGKKVILATHTSKPKNALEFLLAGASAGAGALMFSLSRAQSKFKVPSSSINNIGLLHQAKDILLSNSAVPAELKKVMEHGSSMGGARPKFTVHDRDLSYIAKFNRSDDIVNVVKVEHACMEMLNELDQMNVANSRVLSTENGDVLLVERFDRFEGRPSCHFISANSLFNIAKVSNHALSTVYSYGGFAEILSQYSTHAADAKELFTRMVFNIQMGNTDDHAKNHAFLYHFTSREWSLSPAYDVLPINSSRTHGIGIGDAGREGTLDNALSQCRRFGLKTFQAKKIIHQVRELTDEWPHYFAKYGVDDGDIEKLAGIIPS